MTSQPSKSRSWLGGFGCLLLIFAFGYLVVGVILLVMVTGITQPDELAQTSFEQ